MGPVDSVVNNVTHHFKDRCTADLSEIIGYNENLVGHKTMLAFVLRHKVSHLHGCIPPQGSDGHCLLNSLSSSTVMLSLPLPG